MGASSSWLHEKLFPGSSGGPVPPDVLRAFDEDCRARFDGTAKIVAGVALAGCILWWPLDRIVFGGFPGSVTAMIWWRISVIAVTAAYLLLPRTPAVRRALFWIFTAVWSAGCFTAAVTAGLIGGPDKPFYHTLYVSLLGTVPLPISLGRRAVATATSGAVAAVGFFAPYPQHLSSPYAPLCVSFQVAMILVSLWFGHTLHLLARRAFVQAHELAEHARMLESRVAERTLELRTLLDRVESAREAERARIARELHDELGQELSALRFSLGFTTQRYASEPGGIGANLAELEDLLRRTATSMRGLVSDLRPRVLDDLGLGAAVEWLARRTEQRSGLACRTSLGDGLAGLDDRVATTAFRIVQEALTNVTRHAEAHRVDVEVAARGGAVELCVTDDGIGIEASRARSTRDLLSGGVGLVGMRERVQALNGTLSVRDLAPAPGTEVRCRLPLPAREDCQPREAS